MHKMLFLFFAFYFSVFSAELFAFPGDSCRIDSANAVSQLRRTADSLEIGIVEFESLDGWFDNVLVCRAVTAGIHWDNVYLATDCSGAVFYFSQVSDSGYFKLIRSIANTYEIGLSIHKIFNGYLRFVVQQDTSDVLLDSRSLSNLKENHDCIVPPVLERRNSSYLYEWCFRYYSLESRRVYLNSVEFGYYRGFRYCRIQLP